MSRICQITGKKVMVGNNVSHSNRKTKRKYYPNLQTKKFFVPETGEWITLKVSANAIRTTDTFEKIVSKSCTIDNVKIKVEIID